MKTVLIMLTKRFLSTVKNPRAVTPVSSAIMSTTKNIQSANSLCILSLTLYVNDYTIHTTTLQYTTYFLTFVILPLYHTYKQMSWNPKFSFRSMAFFHCKPICKKNNVCTKKMPTGCTWYLVFGLR